MTAMNASSQSNTGSLDLLVNDVPVTTYSFLANGKFRLSERLSPTTLTRYNLQNNINNIAQWVIVVRACCTGYDDNWAKCRTVLDDKAGQIEFQFKVGNDPALIATFDKTTKLTTFDPRPEMTLKASEMSYYVKFLHGILDSIG